MNIQLRATLSTFETSMKTMPGSGRPIDSRNIVVAANRRTAGIPQPNMASTSAPSMASEGLCPSASSDHSPVWNRPRRRTPAIQACRHAARRMKPDSRNLPAPSAWEASTMVPVQSPTPMRSRGVWGAAEMAKAASSRVPAQPVMAVSTATMVRIPSRLTITGPARRSVARKWERRFKPQLYRAA